MQERELGRRGFFKEGLVSAGKIAFDLTATTLIENKPSKVPKKQNNFLRPPGAVEEESFLELCTRCDDCINACPHNSIKKTSLQDVKETPVIIPRENPCFLCEDMPCIKSCKTGALIPVERENVKMGVAQIKKSRCLAWDGQGCQFCLMKCPFPDEAIYLDDFKPVIREDKCTGCGICEQVCLTVNQSAPIKIIPSRHLNSAN